MNFSLLQEQGGYFSEQGGDRLESGRVVEIGTGVGRGAGRMIFPSGKLVGAANGILLLVTT
jgi:hypothetical protein